MYKNLISLTMADEYNGNTMTLMAKNNEIYTF